LDACCTCNENTPGFCGERDHSLLDDGRFQAIFSLGKHSTNEQLNWLIVFVSAVLMLLAGLFLVYAFLALARYLARNVPMKFRYDKVKYSHLTQELEIS
jgi:uncharacterized membrane protein SpoIIM required for sporulation